MSDSTDLTAEQVEALWNQEADARERGEAPDVVLDENKAPELPPAEEPPVEEPAPPADPFEGVPEIVKTRLAELDDLRRQNQELTQHVRTTEGRVAAMQRENEQARKAAAAVASAPTQAQQSAAAKSPAKWDQLKSDFPEWGEAMEAYVSHQLAAIPKPEAKPDVDLSGYISKDEMQRTLEAERARNDRVLEQTKLEAKYPDYQDTLKTTDWKNWFAAQKPEVRVLADSARARDAIRALDMYEVSKKVKTAAEIRTERRQRLDVAATPKPGHTPPAKTVDGMTPEELWNYEATQREKTRVSRGY